MERRLSAIECRSVVLQNFLDQPETSPYEYAKANREFRKLRDSMEIISKLRTKQKEVTGLRTMTGECPEDREMLDMVTEELDQATDEEKRLQRLLLKSLLPLDDTDERECILEVRAGTGGEEASLFAMDIFKMYVRYSQKMGWKFEAVDIAESDLKGFKETSTAISGNSVYGKLKFENGVHRVQQIPVTEKSGRIHTSAISVSFLPRVNENKAKALKVLCARLYEIERTRINLDRSKLRGESLDVFIDALLLRKEMDAIASFSSIDT